MQECTVKRVKEKTRRTPNLIQKGLTKGPRPYAEGNKSHFKSQLNVLNGIKRKTCLNA